MLTPRSVRRRSGAAVVLGAVVAVTSCGKSSGDDDDDAGSAGDPAGASARGGSGASGGSSQSGNGSGGKSASGGAGPVSGTGATSGGPDTGGGTAVGGASSGGRPSAGADSGGRETAGANDGGTSGEGGEPSGAGSGACTSSTCTSTCGDGVVTGSEACDDGNQSNDDGCSSACTVEDGYTCTAADCSAGDDQCVLRLPVVYRDFNAHGATGGHPDFAPGFASNGAVQGLVQTDLDADGKPVQSNKASSDTAGGFMHGQSAFAQWYRDDPPAGKPIRRELVLWDNGDGGYVTRWGKKGEQWRGKLTQSSYGTITLGLAAGLGCSSPDYPGEGCVPGANQLCYDPCTPWGSTLQTSCCADIPEDPVYDGTPLFFPIDDATGVLSEARGEGKVASQYGWTGVPWEHDVATQLGISTPIETSTAPFPSTTHNFHFTSEIEFSFVYSAGLHASFEITGDDDVWMFLNGHLAVDLGSWHVPLNGTLTINDPDVNAAVQINVNDDGSVVSSATKPGTASTYGLATGNVYRVKIFHAERQPEGSTFRLGIHGLNVTRSSCVKN